MAFYYRSSDISYSSNAVFRTIYEPGQAATYGGIYKCTGCGNEIATARSHSLPPQNHHQHTNHNLPIRWQPVVLHG